MLTNLRYTVAFNKVEEMMCVKNETEIEGLKRAYMRDGASFVSGSSFSACRSLMKF